MPAVPLDCTLNHYLCPPDMPVASFLDLAATHGFTGIALTVRSLTECPARQLAPMLRARGLSVSSVNSAGYFFFEAGQAHEQAARNEWLVAQAAELGDTALNVIVGGSMALDLHEARERAIEHLHGFAAKARARGGRAPSPAGRAAPPAYRFPSARRKTALRRPAATRRDTRRAPK